MSALSGVEAALFDAPPTASAAEVTTADVDAWVAGVIQQTLGAQVRQVLFRAGRIDAVYGLALHGTAKAGDEEAAGADGRVIVKVHRPPIDHDALTAVTSVLRHLHRCGFPCPRPLAGPVRIDGHTVTVQSLLTAGQPDSGSSPEVRRGIAAGLAEHIAVLSELLSTPPSAPPSDQPGRPPGERSSGGPQGLLDATEIRSLLRTRPAWSDYTRGPWPVPHDPVFDFTTTPPGWEWLDDVARAASQDLQRLAGASRTVLAHGDWYAGNLRFQDGRVVAAFDWDLLLEDEAVVVGLSAGAFRSDAAPTSLEVKAFLDDYAAVRPLRGAAREQARAAVRWVRAFNARCDLAFLDGDPAPGSALELLVSQHRG